MYSTIRGHQTAERAQGSGWTGQVWGKDCAVAMTDGSIGGLPGLRLQETRRDPPESR